MSQSSNSTVWISGISRNCEVLPKPVANLNVQMTSAFVLYENKGYYNISGLLCPEWDLWLVWVLERNVFFMLAMYASSRDELSKISNNTASSIALTAFKKQYAIYFP